MVPPASHRVSRVRRYSGAHRQGAGLRVRGCDPVSPALPGRSAASRLSDCHVVGPTTPAAVASAPVWPLPLSLATTRGISFDFSSSGYLDVSVPPVAPRPRMCSAGGRRASSPGGFSHSETHGSCGHVPLAVDYRGLSRPSSASCAKASTACPWYPSRRHRRRPSLSRICSCMMRSTNWRIFVCVTLCGSQGAAGAGPGDRTPCASRRDEVRDQRAWSVTGPVRLKMSCLSSGFSLERR